jgi:phosphatidylserine/phosphatidylglycerophosphate/cardiolipin synthase-like enzyme
MPHRINKHTKYNYIANESYRLKECEVLRQNTAAEQTSSEEISEKKHILKLYGMTLAGIDPRLVTNALLTISVPLRKGKKKLAGPKADVNLKIRKGTRALLSVEVVRNAQGALSVKYIQISFTHHITITNPSSSLQNNQSSAFSNAVKDVLADVKIKDITIDAQGNVNVDGKIKALGVIKKHLPKNLATVELPKLDDSFLASLGLIESGAKNQQPQMQELKNDFDIPKILNQIGAITKEATFELKINGDSSQMSFLKNNTFFRGPKTPLEIYLSGTLAVDKSGLLSINVASDKSAVKCSLGTYVPSVKAQVRPIGSQGQALVNLQANIIGTGKEFHVDMFSSQAVRDMMPRRRVPGTLEREKPQDEHEFNSSMGASSINLDASINVSAEVNKVIEQANGSMSLNMKINDPYSKTLERGVAMEGHLGASVTIDNFSYKKDEGFSEGMGGANLSINPAQTTLTKFPEISPISYQYGIVLAKNGGGRIVPPEYGLSRFVKPLRNFEGHNERIDGSLTKGPLYPVGSEKYFKQVEQITGAKLRHASKVKLLIDGVNSMPERLKLINEAMDYICFQTLVFKNDESGWQYAKALVDAARRGVKVYGIVDSLGNVESLKDLEDSHPIYEYLKENGVELMIYNSFVEDGFRAIFALTKKYPQVFLVDNPKSLKSIAQLLRFLEQVIEVAEDKSGALSNSERSILKNAIHTIFDGKVGVSPEVAVNELRDVLVDNVATLEELLSLTKRIGRASYRWHEKYLVVDHKAAVVGGMNIAKEYLEGGTSKTVTIHGKEQPTWRDTDVLIEGEAAIEAYRSFRRNWLYMAHAKLDLGPKIDKLNHMVEDGYAVSLIQHRPLEDGDHKVVNYLLYNLRMLNPGEKAWFETAYYLPRGILRILQKELTAAAKRGVDVRLITNSEMTSDFGPLVEASAFDVRELLQAGARVFYRNDNRMVHAKVMVLGDKLTMVGSWNMDNRSATHDSEDVCTIYDVDTNQEMTEVLIKDMMDHSDEITLKSMENRKLSQEIRGAGMLLAAEMV